MIFVDTNYFVRFFVNGETEQGKLVKKLFEEGASKRAELSSSSVVFFEIYWLMKSIYGKKKDGLFAILRDILAMSFIKWESGKILTEAVELMKKTNYDLEDAYNLIYAKSVGSDELASFDSKLQKAWKKY